MSGATSSGERPNRAAAAAAMVLSSAPGEDSINSQISAPEPFTL